ncbi:hypothetical protein [Amycolatopsis sp. FDAARGOS 1241]|uniref:hypothetical protein n=1 Tax=Amycolatopsis sp. FDAARGOS 1241 TaxID=2778070 RepID=UPI0019504343|nr:hypothetical protein [Amycolatopsis sp. FDAARGOS 1241]QRP49184.1 hypothetical protein I6J71_16225 [Amycolatopsis sp. FDAARGOS 1241]
MPDGDLMGFLIIGLILVAADGQVLYRGGRRYLRGPNGGEAAGSMARMVVAVFHLVAIGVLALLSVVGPAWSGSAAAVVGRVGVFLLLLAVVHGLTLVVLARRRQDEVVETSLQERDATRPPIDPQPRPTSEPGHDPMAADASWRPTTVTPVPGQTGPYPQVSPDSEDRGPDQT